MTRLSDAEFCVAGSWWRAWKRKLGVSSEGPKRFALLIKCSLGNGEPPENLRREILGVVTSS